VLVHLDAGQFRAHALRRTCRARGVEHLDAARLRIGCLRARGLHCTLVVGEALDCFTEGVTEYLSEAQGEVPGVEHPGMDVAAGDGIPDAEQEIAVRTMVRPSLRLAGCQCLQIGLAVIARRLLELLVDVGVGLGAALGDHPVRHPLDRHATNGAPVSGSARTAP
jgi:hypothetical protein